MPKGIYPRQPRVPKSYPDAMVQRVSTLYDQGLTQAEVAKAIGVSQHVIFRLMANHGIASRPSTPRNQWGSANAHWRGPAAGYQAKHLRVYRLRGRPWPCSVCGATTLRRTYDRANLTGRYDDLDDYAAMCRSCHRTYDNRRKEVMPSSP